jgi:tRNA(adenine34) deaminase
MMACMKDQEYLEQAKEFAKESHEPVPCAVILVDKEGSVIARAYNSQREDHLTASHAEMKAVAIANNAVGDKFLRGVTAYCTCEPCTMCLTALIFAEVNRVVFATRMDDYSPADQRITIDCFDFARQFPHPPKLEYLPA